MVMLPFCCPYYILKQSCHKTYKMLNHLPFEDTKVQIFMLTIRKFEIFCVPLRPSFVQPLLFRGNQIIKTT